MVKTPREKAEEKRQVKLDLAREEVQNGMVAIRQMTEEERRRNLARITAQATRRRYRWLSMRD